jgi:hypothetical protein
MRAKTLTPELAAERGELLKQLDIAQAETAATLRTGGRPLEGVLLQRHLEAEAREAAIVRRIREIDGTVGVPWMAL